MLGEWNRVLHNSEYKANYIVTRLQRPPVETIQTIIIIRDDVWHIYAREPYTCCYAPITRTPRADTNATASNFTCNLSQFDLNTNALRSYAMWYHVDLWLPHNRHWISFAARMTEHLFHSSLAILNRFYADSYRFIVSVVYHLPVTYFHSTQTLISFRYSIFAFCLLQGSRKPAAKQAASHCFHEDAKNEIGLYNMIVVRECQGHESWIIHSLRLFGQNTAAAR